MKKRFLAAVLALVMTAACMTACGGENKTEDKQQTTTTTTAETTTTTTAETTTTTEKETGVIDTFTITKVTPAEGGVVPPSEIPQDVNPGQWHEDSETTTTTTTTKAATTTKPKTTTTKAKTTTKPKATTTKATTTKAKVSTTNGYWHEDPGITKADLKAAAEAAFAKVKKTAIEYGWKIAKTFVNRSTDTQYGIYCLFEISEAASADGAWHSFAIVIKAENINGFAIVQASQTSLGVNAESENYDDFSDKFDISYVIKALKERY